MWPTGPEGVSYEAFDDTEAPPTRRGRGKLREANEAITQGKALDDVVKALGVSLTSFYRWRDAYGSTDRDAVKRMKELERENTRLKRLVAGQALCIQILKEVANGEF